MLNAEWWSAISVTVTWSSYYCLHRWRKAWSYFHTISPPSCTLILEVFSAEGCSKTSGWLKCRQSLGKSLSERSPGDAYITGDVSHVAAMDHLGCVWQGDHVALHPEEV